jgi:hypothetical protein
VTDKPRILFVNDKQNILQGLRLGAADVRGKTASRGMLGVAMVAWAMVVCGASAVVWRYKSEPGARSDAPSRWPATSHIDRCNDRTTMVVFVHPKCPCTSATLAEFRRFAGDTTRVAPRIVFLVPDDVDPSWREGRHWTAARDIPGALVTVDRDGAEARRFGAETSGHTVAYAAGGDLLFSGGITTARGHVGESPIATRSILRDAALGTPASAPVFGCPLGDGR